MGANRSTEQISVYSFVFPVALESKAENKETGRCNTKHTVTMTSVISKNIGRNREKNISMLYRPIVLYVEALPYQTEQG